MQYVLAVAKSIATHMTDYRLIVSKSTVPVGTADQIAATIHTELAKRAEGIRSEGAAPTGAGASVFVGAAPPPRMNSNSLRSEAQLQQSPIPRQAVGQ